LGKEKLSKIEIYQGSISQAFADGIGFEFMVLLKKKQW